MTQSVHTARYENFRHMLIDARKAAGLSQRDLAPLLGRPQSFVSKYERGERRLDVIEFLEVSRALGLDPLDFLRLLTAGEENDMPDEEGGRDVNQNLQNPTLEPASLQSY